MFGFKSLPLIIMAVIIAAIGQKCSAQVMKNDLFKIGASLDSIEMSLFRHGIDYTLTGTDCPLIDILKVSGLDPSGIITRTNATFYAGKLYIITNSLIDIRKGDTAAATCKKYHDIIGDSGN